jgi:hypothetical protein
MLKKPEIYDSVEVKEFDFVPLGLGGHKGIIKTAEEYTSQISYNTSLKVTVDTDKNDKQPNYFGEQFKNDTRTDKKWSNGAIKYVSLKEEENCVRMLKAFITAVENSNQGFKYDWNKGVEQLNGKKIGLIFGLEEYNANDGTVKTTTKLTQFRSVNKVDNAQIPKVKTLNSGYVDYDDYMEYKEETNPFAGLDDVVEIDSNLLD